MPKTICLIVPCFNEEKRLRQNAESFLRCPFNIVFVSDGSTDGTSDWVKSQNKTNWNLLELPDNVGKAEGRSAGDAERPQNSPTSQICPG